MMPECKRVRPAEFAICTACWKVLPTEHRNAISRAFRGMSHDRISGGMRLAIAAARAWLLEHFADAGKTPDPTRWERLVRWVREKDEARRAARSSGEPVPWKPRCPSPKCPCQECVVEYGAPS